MEQQQAGASKLALIKHKLEGIIWKCRVLGSSAKYTPFPTPGGKHGVFQLGQESANEIKGDDRALLWQWGPVGVIRRQSMSPLCSAM